MNKTTYLEMYKLTDKAKDFMNKVEKHAQSIKVNKTYVKLFDYETKENNANCNIKARHDFIHIRKENNNRDLFKLYYKEKQINVVIMTSVLTMQELTNAYNNKFVAVYKDEKKQDETRTVIQYDELNELLTLLYKAYDNKNKATTTKKSTATKKTETKKA